MLSVTRIYTGSSTENTYKLMEVTIKLSYPLLKLTILTCAGIIRESSSVSHI